MYTIKQRTTNGKQIDSPFYQLKIVQY